MLQKCVTPPTLVSTLYRVYVLNQVCGRGSERLCVSPEHLSHCITVCRW